MSDCSQNGSLPLYYPFNKVYRDDTLQRTIKLKDGTTGLAISLTNATVKMQIRTPDLATIMQTLQIGSGITIVDNSIVISADINFDAGEYVYDLAVTDASSVKTTYLYGAFIVYNDVSK